MIEITETKEKLIHLPGKWLIIGPNSLVGSAFIDQTAKV